MDQLEDRVEDETQDHVEFVDDAIEAIIGCSVIHRGKRSG